MREQLIEKQILKIVLKTLDFVLKIILKTFDFVLEIIILDFFNFVKFKDSN